MPADITSNLIHHWRFDDGTGSVVEDLAGSLDGTAYNSPAWVRGIHGSHALKFNGVNQYVSVGNLDLSTFTFACWYKRARVIPGGDADGIILSVGNNGWGMGITDAQQLFITKVGVDGGVGTRTITDYEWHHVAMTYNGSQVQFYIDGKFDAVISYTSTFNSSGGNYTFMSRGTSQYIPGSVDDARVYSRVLTDEDVLALYQDGISASGCFTHYATNRLMDMLFGIDTFDQPDLYLALLLAPGNDASNGGSIHEPSGGGYGRILVTGSDFSAASDGEITNSVDILFDEASDDLGTIVGIALCDASTGGNVIAYGALDVESEINAGQQAQFSAGQLVFGFVTEAHISNYYRNAFLDHIFDKSTFSPPGIYITVATAAPARTSTGATIAEPSAGLARLSTMDSYWFPAEFGAISNNTLLSLAEAQEDLADGDAMEAIVLVDDPDVGEGNVIMWIVPNAPKAILTDDTPLFAPGDLEFVLV